MNVEAARLLSDLYPIIPFAEDWGRQSNSPSRHELPMSQLLSCQPPQNNTIKMACFSLLELLK